LVAVLPFLSFINLWPKHLSGSIYTGNKDNSEIIIPEELVKEIPEMINPTFNNVEYLIFSQSWAIRELAVAMNPSKNTHLTLYKQLCLNNPDYAFYFVFIYHQEPDLLTGKREKIIYFCSDFIASE
jgi:hypothetical protein